MLPGAICNPANFLVSKAITRAEVKSIDGSTNRTPIDGLLCHPYSLLTRKS